MKAMITPLMRISLFAMLLVMGLSYVSQAQAQPPSEGCEDGWCWGDRPGDAKAKFAQYSDSYKFGSYEDAVEPLEWLLTHTPNLNKSIYQNGVKIYQTLAEKVTDETLRNQYEDRALELYDLRVKYYGEEDKVLQFKGGVAYNYLVKRKKYDELLAIYDKILEINGSQTNRTNLVFLMSAVSMSAKIKKLTDEQVIGYYERISDAIDANLATAEGEEAKAWADLQDKIDGMLGKAITIDCKFVREKLGPVITARPDDIKTAKRVMAYMAQAGCTDDPLFLQATINVVEKDPTVGRVRVIYKRYLAQKDTDKAERWIKRGIEIASEEPEKKAEMYMDLASLYAVKGNRADARAQAYKAAETYAGAAKDAYSFIGDLYYSSGSICSDNNPVKARAVYLAAYNMYERAGNAGGMAKAKEQFPSMEEIFSHNFQEGASIEVGCWIGGTAIIRRR